MEKEFRIGPAVVECDVEATERAYWSHSSYAAHCSCEPCKNYLVAREQVLPNTFVQMLKSLGVNHEREIEVYHCARLTNGKHLYEGWFYAVGKITKESEWPFPEYGDPEANPFGFSVSAKHAWLPASFKGVAVFTVDFFVHVPWLIDAPEPK
jgi:hypothetical protein